MRGQAFVTFPSIDLAHRALVCICTKLDVIVGIHFYWHLCFFGHQIFLLKVEHLKKLCEH